MKASFVSTRLKLFVAILIAASCFGASAIAQQKYSITINDVPKQKLLCVGSSAVPLHDNVPAWATEAMADSIYKSLGFKGLRLWCYSEYDKTLDDMMARFDNWYIQSGIIDAAKKRGVEVLLLAPSIGEEMPAVPMEQYTRKLADFIKKLKDERGIIINVTGVANEPGFTVAQMTDAVKLFRHELDIRGLNNVGIVAPESSSADEKGANYVRGIKNDASAWNGLQGIASHSYNMAANKEFEGLIKGTPKQYWMTEASDNGNEGPNDDTRAATTTARFLNDMNHSVDNWFFFIGYKSSTDVTTDDDNATKLIVYDFKSGKLFPHLKYFYFKQIRSVFDYNAVFRDAVSATEGDMVYTYGQKPAINCAAAKNPDGTWGIGAVNLTGINPTFFGEWYYPAATYSVTIHVKELANVAETNFRLYRSSASKRFIDDGIVTMKYGSVTVSITPKEFISLRSIAATSSKADQSINFAPLSNKVYSDAPFVVNAASSSGLPVSLSVTSGPAIIAGNIVTVTGTGIVEISANQQGNENYNAAPTVRQSFSVLSNAATAQCSATGAILYEQWKNVGGNNISDHNYNKDPGNSRLISLFEGPTDVDDNYASRIRGYICAPQTGNFTFWIAGDDATELYVSKSDDPVNKQRIAYSLSWTNPREWNRNATQKSAQIYLEAGKKYYIEALHKEGGGGDNLSVAWQLPSGEMEAPISGNHLSPFQVNAAVAVDQTITFNNIADVTVGAAPFALTASASSGLPVSFRVVAGTATITNNLVTVTSVGTVTIEASQQGNALYNAAAVVIRTFNVNPPVLADQTITFNNIADVTVGAAPFALSAFASSGLPVSFRVVAGSATITNNLVTVTAVGTVTIEASQQGNALYNAAPVVTRTFNVNPPALADQTITFSNIADVTIGAAPFALSASASSGLPVSFRVVSGSATISNNLVTVTSVGTVTIEASQQGNASYNAAPVVTRSFKVIAITKQEPSVCSATGTILYEQWDNVDGNSISNNNWNNKPNSTSQLTMFEGPTDIADNYASRIRGFICPPATGNYIFWIAGDNEAVLYLSTDDNPASKTRIAYHGEWTASREWNKYASQKSASIFLEAGKKYYIEALHKEGAGGDNLAAAWQLPDGSFEGPIAGSHLSPFESSTAAPTTVTLNQSINFATLTDVNVGDAPFALTATATSGLPVSFRVVSGPATVEKNIVTINNVGTIRIEASQPGNATYNAAPPVARSFTALPANQCGATGYILREYWNNVGGNNIWENNWHSKPDGSNLITSFEGPENIGDNYASRIRGYICPPQDGYYTFWISGDDATELYISVDANPNNKTKIAYNVSWTSAREWNKYETQKSVLIYLQAGKKYYIEAIQKEGGGGDNLAVGWQLPNGLSEMPVPGNRLSPYNNADETSNQVSTVSSIAQDDAVASVTSKQEITSVDVQVFPNPATSIATIALTPEKSGTTVVKLNDFYGRPIRRLYDGMVEAGVTKKVSFNVAAYASGVYMVEIITGNKRMSRKIVIVR